MTKKFFQPEDFIPCENSCVREYEPSVSLRDAVAMANIKIEPILQQLKEAREIIEMHAKHGSHASKEFLERWKE